MSRAKEGKNAEEGGGRPVEARNEPGSGAGETLRAAEQRPSCIVGVGASAGGLEAYSQLVRGLPHDCGIALVLVQHLAPDHESILASLLREGSPLPIEEASDGVRVLPNHIYVIPPKADLTITGETLHLAPRSEARILHTPIDLFLTSLAESAGSQAVGIILSGSGTDGSVGAREIKAAGGFVIVQSPESAKYDGMPRASIATADPDLILPPYEMGVELERIARHPLVRGATASGGTPILPEEDSERVFSLLRSVSGVDFGGYRQPTIQRRIQRRMVLHKVNDLGQYVALLERDRGEVAALYRDLLIHVTRFFREPESFKSLAAIVFPQILEGRRANHPCRVWVPGCSTGEEAYSVAISMLEFLGGTPSGPIQVFGTDVSDDAIDHARAGFYSGSIATDVPPDVLRRYFMESDGGYKVSKLVREMCIFARQDVTRDPPFSKLDLIICRNLLIYFSVSLQRRLLNLFHYALRASGFLMLGASESVGTLSDLFAILDKKNRIYSRRQAANDLQVSFAQPSRGRPQVDRQEEGGYPKVLREVDVLLLSRFAPPAVIVDNEFQIVQVRGQTGRYLELSSGEASLNILKMAREGLFHILSTSLNEARRTGKAVRREGVRLRWNGNVQELKIEILPVGGEQPTHFLILFEERPQWEGNKAKEPAAQPEPAEGETEEARRLREELVANREYLQAIIHDLAAANEELQSANEEILSSNEELQSTNEELDTAREELQSTSEELNTVNEELHARNEELSRVNSDLLNLLSSVQIAIVIVSADLRIRRFTPMAQQVLNLIPTDIGRPFSDIRPNIDCPELEGMVRGVVDQISSVERDVPDRMGNWYSLRIRPYKTVENKIDGAVLALFDITRVREKEAEARRAHDLAEAIVETMNDPLVVLDGEQRIVRANGAFRDRFSATAQRGRSLLEPKSGGTLAGVGEARQALERALVSPDREIVSEVQIPGAGGAKARFLLKTTRIDEAADHPILFVVTIHELAS
ncbi:MAG: chemotaxis protein CheB [Candidatus Eisenbacteria bacterium]|nr:chemotaxis protein CheB [Candidatus Eisenbacteria bacterium]